MPTTFALKSQNTEVLDNELKLRNFTSLISFLALTEPYWVPHSCSLEYSLPQSPNNFIGFTPFDAIPFGCSLSYVRIPHGLHPTFPFEFGFLTLSFKRLTCHTSAPFQVRHNPICPVINSRCLSADSISFLWHLFPLGILVGFLLPY